MPENLACVIYENKSSKTGNMYYVLVAKTIIAGMSVSLSTFVYKNQLEKYKAAGVEVVPYKEK